MQELFTLVSEEGLPIRGTLEIPEKARGLVVVAHGFKGFREWGFFPWIAEEFASAGVATCRFDFSRNGIGDDSETFERLDLFADDTWSTQLADLATVLAFVQTRADTRHLPLFLFGHSRGGGIVILGATRARKVHGVVSWSGISHVDRWDAATVARWRNEGFVSNVNARTGQDMKVSTRILDDFEAHRQELDIPAALSRLHAPLLVVHGEADETVSAEEARKIAGIPVNASLVVIAHGTHTFGAIHPMIHVPRELRIAMEVTRKFVLTYA